jgi:hypothetical protein
LTTIPKIITATTGNLRIDTPHKFVVLGGTGKIGTAVAAHLSYRLSSSSSSSKSATSVIEQCEIMLVGRRRLEGGGGTNDNENEYFQAALQEIENLLSLWEDNDGSNNGRPKITYQYCPDIWQQGSLDDILIGSSSSSSSSNNNNMNNNIPISCVIHTAGPYSERVPTVLDACINNKIPVYVDVSDPIEFLESSLERHQSAIESGTTAILAAGAFPGMSNVLAMEAAAAAAAATATSSTTTKATAKQAVVKDVRFNYFTKGLGGSGTVNLYITNLGFGDDMVMFEKGIRTRFDDLSGRLLGKVDFFINNKDDDDYDNNDNNNNAVEEGNSSWNKDDNDKAKSRVGTQKVFAWPFPEAVTVGKELSITGSSSSAMGTAPEIWNDMLGLLVDLVPRNWWRSRKFSKFLADFSEPLVLATDFAMRKLSSSSSSSSSGGGDCGETHAMRIDVITETEEETIMSDSATATTGSSTTTHQKMTSIVQCHDSFRICVGQSCAEFALDALLENPSTSTKTATDTTDTTTCTTGGVYLPEQRYRNDKDRTRIVSKLTNTPGTFAYVGPVTINARPISANSAKETTRREEVDRIVLKQTPTPGLICNGSPIEIRIERKDPVDRQGATFADDGDGDDDRRPTTLPVYPTDVREIVEATQNRIR